MSCVKTLSAWRIGKKPNGKDLITFNPPLRGGEYIPLPCGQCIECRLERSRLWAVRCMHEASLSDDNCFITLTFNDENVDPIYSLRKRDFQLFMKRLRKYLSLNPIRDTISGELRSRYVRYFHAGEYGEEFSRPHHHAILFGIDFLDKKFKRERDGMRYYESETLFKLWSNPKTGESYGFHEISDVTFESCAYVARYVLKKINGKNADDHYTIMDDQGNFHKRLPEFCTMSRRPGIGSQWYEKYKDTDIYPHDRIVIRGGFETKPPRYYSNKYELTNPLEYDIVRQNRIKKAKENPDNAWDRQTTREIVKTAQVKFLKRNLK